MSLILDGQGKTFAPFNPRTGSVDLAWSTDLDGEEVVFRIDGRVPLHDGVLEGPAVALKELANMAPDAGPADVVSVADCVGPLFGAAGAVRGSLEVREPVSAWRLASRLIGEAVRLVEVAHGRSEISLLGETGLEVRRYLPYQNLSGSEGLYALERPIDLSCLMMGDGRAKAIAGYFLEGVLAVSGYEAPPSDVGIAVRSLPAESEFVCLGPAREGLGLNHVRAVSPLRSSDDGPGPKLVIASVALGGRYGARVPFGVNGTLYPYGCVRLPSAVSYLYPSDELTDASAAIADEGLQMLVEYFTRGIGFGWSPAPGGSISLAPAFSCAFQRLWFEIGSTYPNSTMRVCPHCQSVFDTGGRKRRRYCSQKCQEAAKSARQYSRKKGGWKG